MNSGRACERFTMRLLGWVLMTNHFHLGLESTIRPRGRPRKK
ncbi:MAG: hypothetical protein M5U25_10185 [Planctomycetota bacterium]|nr:hypothetical protein [Planctomycetota bacterium]